MVVTLIRSRGGEGARGRGLAWAEGLVEAERERWLLWLPVAFGSGVAFYFLAAHEPPWWSGLLPLAILGLALLRLRAHLVAAYLLALGLAVAAGFCAAQLRTELVAAPLLTEEVGPTNVEGLVLALERRPKDSRLLLQPSAIAALPSDRLPRRIRLRVAGSVPLAVVPGDRVRLRAVLLPPPPPVVPGGFDFGRQAFYAGIGATGFVLGGVSVEAGTEVGGWRLFWARLRDSLGGRVRASLPPDQAGVAEALLTGQRSGISGDLQEDYRRSGLAHLLAISGLHVGLIAGIFFFSLRALLALWPRLALTLPIKKVAALVTALLLPLYLPMVGASVPTQRACFMALVVLAAVLLDRRAISLRLVAFAALLVLAWTPETLLSASFQLSFAAVTALVTAYEAWSLRRPEWERETAWERRLLVYLLGVLASSLIASLATAPFAAYHFQRLALYGIAANLAAVPLTAFWIMPWCLVAYLLTPLGLEELAFLPLGWGLSALNWIATEAAAWPGATVDLPAMPLWGLIALAAGGLWLCLWRSAWRLAGLALLLAGAASPAFHRPPDILIDGEMRLIGLSGPEGDLWLSSSRVERFAAEVWLRRRAQEEAHSWTPGGPTGLDWLACDSLGCRYRRESREVALALTAEALVEDCSGVDLLISWAPLPRGCLRGGRRLDRFDFWRNGTHAVWLSPEIDITSVEEGRGVRPWNPSRGSGRKVYVP